MTDQSDLRTAWKEANAGVREAEERLGAAWTAFAAGKGSPPDKSLLEEVSRRRRECDQRLLALLDEQGRRAQASKERPGA